MKVPLIVEVEAKDGRIRNVVLCKGHTDLEKLPQDDDIAYYFDDDEASKPEDLIGLGVFGMVEEEGDAIVKVNHASSYPGLISDFPSVRAALDELTNKTTD